jgi:CRISPR-associated protein Csm2
MSTIQNLQDLEQRLQKEGTLAALLNPQDFAPEGMVADSIAQQYKAELKPTQMRKVFHTFKKIEIGLKPKRDEDPLDAKQMAEISLLVPNLAYAAGRDLLPKPFYNVLKLCLSSGKMQTVADFRRLTQLLTAILAYQKYYDKDKAKDKD